MNGIQLTITKSIHSWSGAFSGFTLLDIPALFTNIETSNPSISYYKSSYILTSYAFVKSIAITLV